MTKVTITFDDGSTKEVVLSDAAKEAIRFSFNPSDLATVNTVNALSGAFLSYCDEIQNIPTGGGEPNGRELAVAKTNMQTASMWAVLGAMKGL